MQAQADAYTAFFDAVIVLKRGRAVTVTETLKRWAKVTTGKHKVWIPTNGLAKVPAKTYKAVDKIDSGDVSSSPAGLAAAAKGFASLRAGLLANQDAK